MATATITIPNPVIGAGMHFKVRYRSLPAGSWTTMANQDNDPFTITGLSTGSYELEATLVIGSTECPATIYPFSVLDTCPCLSEIAVTFTSDTKGTAILKIDYAAPVSLPDCGWIVTYGPVGGPQVTVPYATLPVSLSYLASPGVYNVKIQANCCNGSLSTCFDEVVTSVDEECDHSICTVDCDAIGMPPDAEMIFTLISQSVPPTTSFTIQYLQTNMQAGAVPDSGTIVFTPAPGQTVFTWPITPNPHITTPIDTMTNTRPLTYQVYVTDNCKRYGVSSIGTWYL